MITAGMPSIIEHSADLIPMEWLLVIFDTRPAQLRHGCLEMSACRPYDDRNLGFLISSSSAALAPRPPSNVTPRQP
jgi:hypothetical protein